MPRVDGMGIPISNMDEVTLKREGADLVAYDCRGDVAYRIRVEPCLAIAASGCCPIEDEDGGFNHSHVCQRKAHDTALFHLCNCGKSWEDVPFVVS